MARHPLHATLTAVPVDVDARLPTVHLGVCSSDARPLTQLGRELSTTKCTNTAPRVRKNFPRLDPTGSTLDRACFLTRSHGRSQTEHRDSIEPVFTGEIMEPSAFQSYTHDDDSDGSIRAFKERLEIGAKLILGKPFKIFFDRDDIAWGASWDASIKNSLNDTTFLIPII